MCEVKLDMNCNINDLIDQVYKMTGTLIKKNGITYSSPNGNDKWISILNDEQVVSMYWHPTKRHHATAHGKTKPPRSKAAPRCWAVAIAMRSSLPNTNKTYYGADADD